MKKNIFLLSTMIIAASVMCGCGASIPEMSETETAMVTEYATNLLIKYSQVADRELLNDEELKAGIAEEAKEKERLLKTKEIEQAYLQAAANGENVTDSEEVNAENSTSYSEGTSEYIPQQSVDDFFAEDNFSIEYTSYSLCESYPEESSEEFFMAMDATEGKQLCIVKFSVKNELSSDQELDMYAKQGRFTLRMDDGTTVSAQSTLLMDDLSSYAGTIPANGEEEMVLVFEVPDSVSQMGSMELIMRDQSGENTLMLQ